MFLNTAKLIAYVIAVFAISGAGVGIGNVLEFLIEGIVYIFSLLNLLNNYNPGLRDDILFICLDIIINYLKDLSSFSLVNMSSGNPTGPLDKIFGIILYYSNELWFIFNLIFHILYILIYFVVYGTFCICRSILFFGVPLAIIMWLSIYFFLERDEDQMELRQDTIKWFEEKWQMMELYYNKLQNFYYNYFKK